MPTLPNSRIVTSIETKNLTPAQINELFAKAGLPVRDVDKLKTALEHSILCVTARGFRDENLVGFVRVTGDGVFNAAIWDFAVDPTWANPQDVKHLIIQRLKQEIRRLGLQCSVTIFATPADMACLKRANFSEDRDGIRAMALPHEALPGLYPQEDVALEHQEVHQNETSGIV